MKNTLKRALSVLTACMFLLSSVSLSAFAAVYDATYMLVNGDVSITSGGSYLVKGGSTETTNYINVGDNLEVSLDIQNLNMVGSRGIVIGENSVVNLNIIGNNLIKLTLPGVVSNPGIWMKEGAQLTIDAADNNQVLTVYGGQGGCGIGSSYQHDTKSIVINGGTVNAYGYDWAAGIGSSCEGHIDSITINGGKVYADGTLTAYPSAPRGSAGIGCGAQGSAGTITINGGEVEAVAGRLASAIGATWRNPTYDEVTVVKGVHINGGKIKATGGVRSSGIGGAYQAKCGEIIITGGTIYSQGGVNGLLDEEQDTGGSGIGAGNSYGVDKIRITGGNITAIGSSAEGAGIGCSYGSTIYQEFTIGGDAIINAMGGEQASGIGCGTSSHIKTDLNIGGNAKVTAIGGRRAAAIGTGDRTTDIQGDIIINGNAEVKAIGNAEGTGIGTITPSARIKNIVITDNAKVEARAGATSGYAIGSYYNEEENQNITISGKANVLAYSNKTYPAIGNLGGVDDEKLFVRDEAVLRAYSGTDDAILYNAMTPSDNGRTVLQGTFKEAFSEDKEISVANNISGDIVLPAEWKSFACVVNNDSENMIKVDDTFYQGQKTFPQASDKNTIKFFAAKQALSKYINLEPAYNVELSAQGPGSITGTKQYIAAKGQTLATECHPALNYAAVPSANAYLAGWENINGLPENETIQSDTTFVALFKSNAYTVTFDAAGGTPVPEAQTVDHGDKATEPAAPEKEGYDFEGWYLNDGDKWDFDTPVTENLNLIAHWKAKDYDYIVKYEDEQGGTLAPQKTSGAEYNTTVTEQAVSIPGYTPKQQEKSITIKTSVNIITFVYTKNTVGYTVRYVDGNGRELAAQKTGSGKFGETVTENPVNVRGYAPRENEKAIVLKADSSENVITFTYDLCEYPYTVRYQDASGNKLCRDKTGNALFGSTVQEQAVDIEGYKPREDKKSITIDTENNIIIFVYDIQQYDYTVRYVDEDGKDLADEKTGRANYGSVVTENAISIDGYAPDAASKTLTIKTSENVITFIYTKGVYPYIVRYVDEDGNALSAEKTGRAPFDATVNETAIDIEGYKPEQTHKSLVIGTGENIIVFVYEIQAYDYTVKYQDTDGNALLPDKNGRSDYGTTVTEIAPAVKGYTPRDSEKAIVIDTANNLIIFTYDVNRYEYSVKYVNSQGENLLPDKNGTSDYGTTVTEIAPDIKGYTPRDNEKSIVIDTEDNLIIFTYDANEYEYVVKYVTTQGEDLAPQKTGRAKYASAVTETAVEVPGYTPDAQTKSIEMSDEDNIIVFIYTANDVGYIVRYIEEGGDAIAPDKTGTGKVDSTVRENSIDIIGFTPKAEQKSLVLRPDERDNEIVFEYTRNKYPYTVRYVDESGAKLAEDKAGEGLFGELVTEYPIDIPGYRAKENHVSIEITERENLIVIVYEARDVEYVVRYVDEQGKELAKDKKAKAPMASTVTETAKDIEHYKPLKEQISIVMRAEENEIVFVYRLITHSVTFDPDNGEENFTETVPDGEPVGEPDEPEKKGYEFDGWYTPEGERWDFDTPIEKDTVLIAHWVKLEKKVKAPHTGEAKNIVAYVAFGVAIAALVGTFIWKKRRK